MDTRGYIDVTEIDIRRLIQAAFMGSSPQGLGFLHHSPGALSEEEMQQIMDRWRDGRGVSLDYVRGRSMKFHIRESDGHRYINLNWYDHGKEATKQLCRDLSLPDVEARIEKAEAGLEEIKREYAAEVAQR